MKKFQIKTGDSKFFFTLSLINGGLYFAWLVAYIVCTILRASAINSAQTSMALGGYSTYTIEVTSPMFGVLRALAYVLPVVLCVWIAVFFIVDRKNVRLCDNRLIIGVFGADVVSALLCALDITTLHMIF